MIERFHESQERYNSIALRDTMAGIDSLPKFRAFLSGELEKAPIRLRDVPVNAFLHDFGAQIELRELFQLYGSQTRSGTDTPVIILKEDKHEIERGDGASFLGETKYTEPQRFRLADPDHLYYFSQYPIFEPAHVVYTRIDTEDPPLRHDLVPLNRVSVLGGPAEQYSHGMQLWEENGQGSSREVGEGNGNRGGINTLGDRIDAFQQMLSKEES